MITIEPATAGDIPKLVEFLKDLFGIELDFTTDALRQQRGLELLVAEMARSDRLTVAVARGESGEVLGMASAQLVISTAEGAPSAWIEDVVISHDHRREGIGKQLLDYLIAWAKARGATRAQLVMDRDNAGAELFYNGMGWHGTQLAVRRFMID